MNADVDVTQDGQLGSKSGYEGLDYGNGHEQSGDVRQNGGGRENCNVTEYENDDETDDEAFVENLGRNNANRHWNGERKQEHKGQPVEVRRHPTNSQRSNGTGPWSDIVSPPLFSPPGEKEGQWTFVAGPRQRS